MRPIVPLSTPATQKEKEPEVKKVTEITEMTENTDCNVAKNEVVVVAVETILPSLGEDKTEQRCVSFELHIT